MPGHKGIPEPEEKGLEKFRGERGPVGGVPIDVMTVTARVATAAVTFHGERETQCSFGIVGAAKFRIRRTSAAENLCQVDVLAGRARNTFQNTLTSALAGAGGGLGLPILGTLGVPLPVFSRTTRRIPGRRGRGGGDY
jgi:hypothetical protein